MSIDNCSKLNDKTIEFEIYIQTSATSFILTSYQCAFTFNSEIINGGSISLNYVLGSSQLNNYPNFGIGVNNLDNQLELTFASLVGTDTVNNAYKRVGKFKLTNTANFTGLGFSLLWNFTGSINTILTGANFINITNPSNHLDLVLTWDTTPPALQSVTVVDSAKIVLNFSETLDASNISNVGNYNINNGITVSNAAHVSPGNKISLTTSAHIPGNTYSISVQNVNDLSGNIISPLSNTANYSFGELLKFKVKIFLQGPFNNGEMKTSLNQMNYLPKFQPYNNSPWNYAGNESVVTVPTNVVDWVLVELRKELNGSTTIFRKAAFIQKTGLVTDIDGGDLKFYGLAGLYYLVIKHRNHLGVISSSKVNISGIASTYDFTTSMSSAYGTNSLTSLGNGLYGIYAGDANGNGTINNTDVTNFWKKQNGSIGYKSADFDLNGGVTIVDKNYFWSINKGKSTNIPTE
jgi:hypothetical protein